MKCTVTVKDPSITLNQTEAALAIGDTVKLAATAKPSSAKVTYASDKTDVAEVAADGTVTAKAAGEATITATATCGTKKVTATAKVTVKKIVLDTVIPEATNVVVATVKGDTSGLKKSDFSVASTETKQTVAVTDLKVDDKDKTKVSLTLAAKLADAKEYGVTLDGVTKTFVASDGTVDSIAVDPVQIPYASPTEIDLVAKDAKGIIVNKMAYGKTEAGYSFTFTKYDGTLNSTDGTLTLNKIGSTAEAKVSYTSSEYNTDGTPKVKKEQTVTITAVDQAAVSNYAVRIGSNTTDKFDKLKDDTRLAVGEDKYAFIKIKDANGNEIKSYTGYTVESSDSSVLLLGSKTLSGASDKYVAIKPVTTGTAYIIVKKDGNYCTSLPINVVAKREAASLTIDNAAFELSNKPALNDTKIVEAKAKDQYGDDVNGITVTTECVYTDAKSAGNTVALTTVNANAASKYYTISGNKVTFKGANVEEGSYTWTVNLKVNDSLTLKQTVNITVKTVTTGDTTYVLEASSTELDAMVKDDADNGDNVEATVKIAKYVGGVKDSYVENVTFVVQKDASNVTSSAIVIGDNTTPNDNTTADSTAGGSALTIKALTIAGGTATKLPTGNYTVKATWNDGKAQEQQVLITVKDSQSGAAVERIGEGVSSATKGTVKLLAEDTLKITLGDYVYANNAAVTGTKQTLTITKVEGAKVGFAGNDITGESVSSGDTVSITKVTFTAKNDNNISYSYTVDVNTTVTNK